MLIAVVPRGGVEGTTPLLLGVVEKGCAVWCGVLCAGRRTMGGGRADAHAGTCPGEMGGMGFCIVLCVFWCKRKDTGRAGRPGREAAGRRREDTGEKVGVPGAYSRSAHALRSPVPLPFFPFSGAHMSHVIARLQPIPTPRMAINSPLPPFLNEHNGHGSIKSIPVQFRLICPLPALTRSTIHCISHLSRSAPDRTATESSSPAKGFTT